MLARSALLRSFAKVSPSAVALARRSISVEIGNNINAANLEIERIKTPKTKVANEKLTFGTTFTDHMLEVDWEQGKGWQNPLIRPYGPIMMDPASSALHYALQCFEGMKAYVDPQGQIRLFRPDMNMKRLNSSMKRLLLPQFDIDQLTTCLKELIKLDKDWVPKGDGYSLYIRPTGISTHPYIGVGASLKAKIFIILSPVGPYYPEGFNPVKLFANDTYIRAWPGGTGAFKLGANYAPGIMPQAAAGQKGYSQNLWIFGPDHEVTEVGTMNLFIHWINEDGEKELITPPLSRGDILPGVTRDSILALAREWGEFKVMEKNVNMKQVAKAVKEGRMLEVFGSGTAAVVSPVSTINYLDEDLNIPLDGTDGKAGKIAERVWKELTEIQYGRKEHPWSVIPNRSYERPPALLSEHGQRRVFSYRPGWPKRAVFVCHSSQEAELRKRISSSSFASLNCCCSEGVESVLIITEAFPKDMQARTELFAQTQVAVLAVDCEFQKSATLIETVSFLKDNRKQVVAGPLSFHSRPSGAIGAICFAFGTWDSNLFDLSSSSSTSEPQPEWSAGTGLAFMSTSEAQTVLANAISEPEMVKLIAEEREILDSEPQKARTELQNGEEQDPSSSNMNSRLLLYVFAGENGERVAAKFASLGASKDDASIQLCSQELASDLATLAKARVAAFVITDACMGDATFHRLFEAAVRWKKPILPINAAKARLSGWLAMAMAGKLWYQVDLNDLEQIHTKRFVPRKRFPPVSERIAEFPQRMLEGAQNQDREAAIIQLCREKAQVMSGLSADQMQSLCTKVQDLVANYQEESGVGRESLEALGVALDLQALEKQLLLQSADCSYTPKDLLPEEPKDGSKLNTIHYQVTRLGFAKLPSVLDE